MDRADHEALLKDGIAGAAWADLGSGTGAFTLALAGLLGPEARIFSLDRDPRALAEQERAFRGRFPGADILFLTADLAAPPPLPPLDGVVAANSLHYVEDLARVLPRILGMLAPGGRLLVVEYEMERPTPWVPWPLPYRRLRETAGAAGFVRVRPLAERPSRFGRPVYSAVGERPRER
jgi:trans-aconitate methyltransferase